MKYLLVITILFLSSTGFAGEQPRTYVGIDNKEHKITNKPKLSLRRSEEIPPAPRTYKEQQLKSRRLWVQDVYQEGLWYYGYYIQINEVYEFRYCRKEFRGALKNFRSLYSVQHKYEVRVTPQRPVKVIYEPAY